LLEKILAFLQTLRPYEPIAPHTDLGILDSLEVLALAAWLEEGLGAEIPEGEMAPHNFATPLAVLALAERNGGRPP
jgi:acyl carrier protein